MSKLLKIDSDGTLKHLQEQPFANEVDDLQNFIKSNPTMLGDNVHLIANQLDTGTGKRLDILAVEEIDEGMFRPVIVELKNTTADTKAFLQVLKYANWTLTNIDSVRLHAKNAGVKYKEIDNSNVGVIIVAPDISDELILSSICKCNR